mgnify:CR=1 FL=1
MTKSIISVEELKYAIKEIGKQIDNSGVNTEIIVSINRGGCLSGVYLSNVLNKPHKMVDIKSIDNQKISVNTLKKFKSALIIDDINDTGKTFTIVKETFDNTNADIRYAALINNISSKTKIEYHGQIINKKENPIWYVFPWENWW